MVLGLPTFQCASTRSKQATDNGKRHLFNEVSLQTRRFKKGTHSEGCDVFGGGNKQQYRTQKDLPTNIQSPLTAQLWSTASAQKARYSDRRKRPEPTGLPLLFPLDSFPYVCSIA